MLEVTYVASFPGLSETPGISCEHDVIEIGPEVLEQKANVFVVQPTMRSTLYVSDVRPPTARYM